MTWIVARRCRDCMDTACVSHDGLMLPTEIAETYVHLAKQHRSTWTHELDLRAFSDRPWWNH
jgi:hypothetical protein